MWKKTLKNQLIFMPVYLLLMYFALSVLTSSSIFQGGYAGNLTTSGGFLSDLMVLALNAVLVIVMLNAPLLAAMSMGAMMPKWAGNVSADKIWGAIGGKIGGIAGRNTIGRGASMLSDSIDKSTTNRNLLFGKSVAKLANTSVGRDLRAATLGAATKAKFGSSRSYEDVGKLDKEIAKKDKEIERNAAFHKLLAEGSKDSKAYKELMDGMSEKERLSIGTDNLINPYVLRHLKKSDFDAIKKSEDISLEDQKKIADNRKKLFESAAKSGDAKVDPESLEIVKDMIKKYEAKDIAEMDEAILASEALVGQMSAEHLKKIHEGTVSDETKALIAKTILAWKKEPTDKQHRAFGWMKKLKDGSQNGHGAAPIEAGLPPGNNGSRENVNRRD